LSNRVADRLNSSGSVKFVAQDLGGRKRAQVGGYAHDSRRHPA
jgi:hypothetical protein